VLGDELTKFDEVGVEGGVGCVGPGAVEVGAVVDDVDGEGGDLVPCVLGPSDVFADREAGGDDGRVKAGLGYPGGEGCAEFVVGVGGVPAVGLVDAVEPAWVGDAGGGVGRSGRDCLADLGGAEGEPADVKGLGAAGGQGAPRPTLPATMSPCRPGVCPSTVTASWSRSSSSCFHRSVGFIDDQNVHLPTQHRRPRKQLSAADSGLDLGGVGAGDGPVVRDLVADVGLLVA
jgi:hypothetical protein